MSAPAISAEIVPAAAGAGFRAEWTALADAAMEPNPFYAPDLALPALAHLPEGRGAGLLAAWTGGGDGARLVGLLPLVRGRGRHVNPLPLRRAAAFYGTLSTPLIDPLAPGETWAAMLAALGRRGVPALALPYLHEDGPVAAGLAEAIGWGRLPVASLGGHRRALLRTPLAFPDYYRSIFDGRRRKDVDRRRRRLGEHGALRFRVLAEPEAVSAGIERFLFLEAAGWKGRRGTAMELAPGAGAFLREAGRAGAAGGRFQVAELTVDGRTVAAGLVAIAGRRAFYLKTAYDESLARFSPGLVLSLDLTAHLLADPGVDDADSIAVADHPMIDRLWTGRFPVGSVVVATTPGGGFPFRAAVAAERAREAVWARVRTRWHRLRSGESDGDGPRPAGDDRGA